MSGANELPVRELTPATQVSWHVREVDLRARAEFWRPPAHLVAEIDAAWALATAVNPALFDGTIHVLVEHACEPARFSGLLAPIAFRVFHYWHTHGRPELGFRDCFTGTLLRSSDGAVLVGEAAAGTLSAGRICLIGGLIDPRDVGGDGRVDIERAARRELAEETGLGDDMLTREPGFWLTALPGMLSVATGYRADGEAASLAKRMEAFARAADPPEISTVLAVRRLAELDGRNAHPYLLELLGAVFANARGDTRSAIDASKQSHGGITR